MRRARWSLLPAAAMVVAVAALLPGAASGDEASQPGSPAAGDLTAGSYVSCWVNLGSALRCWGYGGHGQLGHGDATSIGDDDVPTAAGPIDFGAGRTVTSVSAGGDHTCAILGDGTVRCWGFNGDGRLGYPAITDVGLTDTPATKGPVDLGAGRTAKAITTGEGHSCALLDNDTVRCWGFGNDGRLGYNDQLAIGNDETPGTAGPVDFGDGHTVKSITAGASHTCAILDDDTVRCWGRGVNGQLGYPGVDFVGRGCLIENNVCQPNPAAPTPASIGAVDLGPGRTAKAVSGGAVHTCAILDEGSVRCWGAGSSGRLGYGNSAVIGDNETPGSVGPVDIGAGRTAVAIDAGGSHTCVILDNGDVRCWGFAASGQLGYASTTAVGNTPATLPGSVGPVALGAGRTAKAISTGDEHTCALLDDDSVRCWGRGANGRLGYCSELSVGDNETPAAAGPVELGLPGITGARCAPPPPPPPPAPPPAPEPVAPAPATPGPSAPDALTSAVAAQRARAAALRSCRRAVTRRLGAARRGAHRLPAARRAAGRRLAARRAAAARRACLRRHGRTPGRVSDLRARSTAARAIELSFRVAGTSGSRPPAAQTYVVKQSPRPIRSAENWERAPALCNGRCRFDVTSLESTVTLTVKDLRRNRLYHYAIAARDNVSGRTGPRSRSVAVRAR